MSQWPERRSRQLPTTRRCLAIILTQCEFPASLFRIARTELSFANGKSVAHASYPHSLCFSLCFFTFPCAFSCECGMQLSCKHTDKPRACSVRDLDAEFCQNRAQLEHRSRQLPALPVRIPRYFYTRRIFFEPVSYPQKKARGQLRLWPERRSCQQPTTPVMTRRYLATVRLSFQPISYRQNKTRARSCFGQPHLLSK